MSDGGQHAHASVEQFCGEHFPEHFTGVAVKQQTLLVYRRPHPDFDRQVRAAFPGPRIRFVDSDFSLPELTELQVRVRADRQEWLGRGIRITSVGLAADRVVIGVLPANFDNARPPLEQRYGRAVVVERHKPVLI